MPRPGNAFCRDGALLHLLRRCTVLLTRFLGPLLPLCQPHTQAGLPDSRHADRHIEQQVLHRHPFEAL